MDADGVDTGSVAESEPTSEAENGPTLDGAPVSGLKLDFGKRPEAAMTKRSSISRPLFGDGDDEEEEEEAKKRPKLVPIEYTEEEMRSFRQADSAKEEEKKTAIQNLVARIPTEKGPLFAVDVDWTIINKAGASYHILYDV